MRAPALLSVIAAGACASALCLSACDFTAIVGAVDETPGSFGVRLAHNDDTDVLFVVDNSAAMSEKLRRVRAGLPALAAQISERGVLRIAAVTSDLGAGKNSRLCGAQGDGALLRPVGAAADSRRCAAPADGRPWFEIDSAGASNLPPGETLAQALDCMLDAGDRGCVVQQPLSAAEVALRRKSGPGADFLRPGALLVVYFITDGDDCSLAPNSDLFDEDRAGAEGPIGLRCARQAITTGFPPSALPALPTGGPLPFVAAATGSHGPLLDISRFRDLFSLPADLGGLKADPRSIVVAILSGPPEPVEIIAAKAGTERSPSQVPCAPLDGVSCVAALKHACSTDPGDGSPPLFGAPAVRLRAALDDAKHPYTASICAASQARALGEVGRLIQAQQTGPTCLSTLLVDPDSPSCVVEDVVPQPAGGVAISQIPHCAPGRTSRPCFRLVPDARCPAIPDGAGGKVEQRRIEIERIAPPASGTDTRARCAGSPS